MQIRSYNEQIKKVIEEGLINFDGNIALYPFGKRGKQVKNILNNDFNIKETYIIDNFATLPSIISYEQFKTYKNAKNTKLLLCTDDKKLKEKLSKDFGDFDDGCVIDVFPSDVRYIEINDCLEVSDMELEMIYNQTNDLLMGDNNTIYETLCTINEQALIYNFENYLEGIHLDVRLRRAYALAVYLLKTELIIDKENLLIGTAKYRVNNKTYPEGFWQELEVTETKGFITNEQKEDILSAEYMGLFFRVPGGHVIPKYEKLLNCGIDVVLKEIESYYKETRDEDKRIFYKAEFIVCRALQEVILRYAKMALKYKRENIYTACMNISHNKPENFFEAVQLFWLQHEVMIAEGNIKGISLGRVDQFLYPFYEKDLKAGIITSDRALNILCDLWKKFEFDRSALAFQNVTLGGMDEVGKDASNELTLLCLEAQNIVRHNQPMLSLRVNSNMNDSVWNKAMQVIASGMGVPALFNDKVIMEAKIKAGISKEDAYNYAVVGCVEPSIQGKEYSHTEGLRINWCKILELMLFGGKCPVTDRKWKLKNNYNLCKLNNFNEFINWYKSELKNAIKYGCKILNDCSISYGEMWPTPYLSLLMEKCIEQGMDVTRNGTKYNNLSINFAGMANTVNSLYVIKKLVFESKIVNLEELPKILLNDYADNEKLLEKINELPKYGQDVDEVDQIMQNLIELCIDTINQFKTYRGGVFQGGFYTVVLHAWMGEKMVASPDGRRKGRALASSLSPVQGTDTKGVLSVFNSTLKQPLNLMGNGMVLDIKFSKQIFEDKQQREKIRDVIKAFFKKGGHEIQINVVNKETLIKAQKFPEEYKNLLVRVSGFSTYFVNLDKIVQDEIIQRYENSNIGG